MAATLRFVIDVFHQILEGLERVLYFVDEWLRFRRGEHRVLLVFKAVVGVVWSIVTYVLRFCITLFIEPQFNPIKHFPVVTVSHKLLAPWLVTIAPLFGDVSQSPLGHYAGHRHCVRDAGHSRLPRLGVQGKLAPVCGQSPSEVGAHAGRHARRNRRAAAPTRIPLGNIVEAVCQVAARGASPPKRKRPSPC